MVPGATRSVTPLNASFARAGPVPGSPAGPSRQAVGSGYANSTPSKAISPRTGTGNACVPRTGGGVSSRSNTRVTEAIARW